MSSGGKSKQMQHSTIIQAHNALINRSAKRAPQVHNPKVVGSSSPCCQINKGSFATDPVSLLLLQFMPVGYAAELNTHNLKLQSCLTRKITR